jgi:hypothetical protein
MAGPSPFNHRWFEQRESDAAEQIDKMQWRVAEARTKFFERLSLLSAGAVVLSVSLLATMLGKTAIHSVATLFTAWFGFVVALVAALFRELPYQTYVTATYQEHYLRELINKKCNLIRVASAGATVISEPQENGTVRKVKPTDLSSEIDELKGTREMLAKRSERSHRRFYALEWVSNISFMLGVVLLAIFAAINILKLSHFWIR